MARMRFFSGVCGLALLTACASGDRNKYPGSADNYAQSIRVVEDTVVLEVAMSPAEPGIPYSERRRVEAFLADYKSRGKRYGPLILSVPQKSPFAKQLEASASEAYELAYEYGVQDLKRSDYDSNGSKDAPLVLAFMAYKAIGPDCPSLATINLASTRGNDGIPTLGCAHAANLAAMIAYPADLIGSQAMDPADVIRRSTVLDKYRAGQPTATERADSESGAISNAVE